MKALFAVLVLSISASLAPAAYADPPDVDAERAARWNEVRQAIFGDRQVEPGNMVKIDAPDRALDAALVPIGLTMPESSEIKGVFFIIDGNPSPYAALFTFGAAADPSEIKLRVRVNDYTHV